MTPRAPVTATEATHAEDYSGLVDRFLAIIDADYIPRRAKARHADMWSEESEEAAWVIRCVHAGDRQPRGAHVAAGVSR